VVVILIPAGKINLVLSFVKTNTPANVTTLVTPIAATSKELIAVLPVIVILLLAAAPIATEVELEIVTGGA